MTSSTSNSVNVDSAIAAFEKEALQISKFEPPPILYHYCSYPTFVNMLNSRNLRNSHIQDMNDHLEFAHGMGLFVASLEVLRKKNIAIDFVNAMRDKMVKESRDPKASVFVFCLTPNKDQNSQWDLYGDDGAGVSLGFNSDAFIEPRKVLYSCLSKRRTVSKVLRQVFDMVTRLRTSGHNISDPNVASEIAWAYFRVAFMHSLRFKQKHWRKENEWRGVTTFLAKTSSDIKTCANGKRYIEVNIDFAKELKEVVIGPRAGSDMKLKLEKLKQQYRLNFATTKA